MMSIVRICMALLLFLGNTGCDPVTIAFGGATIVGTTAVRNEEGFGGSLSDTELQAKINHHLFECDRNIFDRVELSVKHGMVVVIGYMQNQEQCAKAIEIVKEVAHPDRVFDETKIQAFPDAKDVAVDSNITSRIKSSLIFDGNVQSLNYDITTVKGVVYICGTAKTTFERDVVLNHARTTYGVKQVVAYIRIKAYNNGHKARHTRGKTTKKAE